MYRTLDINTWNRKETYEYFGAFDFPFFNIISNVDITRLHAHCKEQGHSLNHALHFCSLLAANEIESFRIRIMDGQVVVFDKVDGGATVLLEDQSIRFCLYEYTRSFESFVQSAILSEQQVRKDLRSDPRTGNIDVIHYSVIPWISFTSISHPRSKKPGDSIPKITFGKYFNSEGNILIPVSVEVNHALMDGYQVSQYLEEFGRVMEGFGKGGV
jgi:chloramphenicol O-acetyltransferase type A